MLKNFAFLCGLWLCFIFVDEVASECRENVKSFLNEKQLPTFYNSIKSKVTWQDKYISKKNKDFWQFESSTISIEKGHFKHEFKFSNRTVGWVIEGEISFQSSNPYISWSGVGKVPGSELKTAQVKGRIYILNIICNKMQWTTSSSLNKGCAVAYYSCFDEKNYKNENICISLTKEDSPYRQTIDSLRLSRDLVSKMAPFDNEEDILPAPYQSLII